MSGARWVRADGKRPITISGRPASSTKPVTWSSLEAVRASSAGDGFGVMLGDGLGCYDLDHVTDEQVRAFVSTLPEPVVLIERSRSGTGAHVFVQAEETRGWRRTIDGMNVERYTRHRFIRTTLERIR
ncbi:DNA primase [Cellulomonas hominis]|uniref:DNA primase n=1 Tax=Cellulomonas hominis TaxID=156981 RepID=UPI001444937C|nr:DNA primase [Cellulomonas hominis]NKY08932.1 DNA primase [Cellulomonas hominis]